jgi:putative ABC transport system permease protein
MRPVLRNFISVIRRYKLAVTLNILGLSVAYAAFMVIMIQLNYDYGFDKFHQDYDKIFRMEFSWNNSVQAVTNRPFAERFFESSPRIVAGTLTSPFPWKNFFYVENDGVRNSFEETSMTVTPEYTDVFTFDFVEGDKDALKTPENVIIPLSLARKLFRNESAIGKQLIRSEGNKTVGAVYRDFPANTVVTNSIYFPMPENENKQNWGNWNYQAYLRVNDPSNISLLFDNFKRNFDAQAIFGQEFEWGKWNSGVRLTVLPEIHYLTDTSYDNTPKASRQTLMILFAIAIVIIAIAAINFTNFSTALTPMRLRSINTQRVLGARRSTLRKMLVAEALIVSLVSFFVALILVGALHHSPLAKLVDADLSLMAHPLIVSGTALVAVFAGFLAGLYPAQYITSFAPALVLKGSFGLSPKGRKLRNTLIGIQYIASFALIIGASFMYLQNYFMQNSPLGYEKDELLTVNISKIRNNSREAFTNQLKSYSGIEDVTFGESLLSSSDQYMGWGRLYNGEQINFQCLPVHYTFLKVMDIAITEGRDFRIEDTNTAQGAYVFNETAQKKYNLEIGKRVDDSGEIVGFIPDIKFASFRTAVEPMAFYVWGTENWGNQPNNAYIRIKAGTNMRAAISHIRTTLVELDPDYTYNIRFYDEVLQQMYEKEASLSSLISLFSLLAIFISIVGVFGLVVFDSESRRKEIGVRKVLGASVTGIIIMFNKVYLRILAVCFVIAAPLAWYAVSRWLQNFAYKTPMYWWVYLLAFVAVGIITVCTVTFQNWRVANDNPVNTIKND